LKAFRQWRKILGIDVLAIGTQDTDRVMCPLWSSDQTPSSVASSASKGYRQDGEHIGRISRRVIYDGPNVCVKAAMLSFNIDPGLPCAAMLLAKPVPRQSSLCAAIGFYSADRLVIISDRLAALAERH
jgi:hypothetical protein